MMTNMVISNFSMSGRGGSKLAFRALTIAKAALGAAEKAGLSAMRTAVKKCIREHLRYKAFQKK